VGSSHSDMTDNKHWCPVHSLHGKWEHDNGLLCEFCWHESRTLQPPITPDVVEAIRAEGFHGGLAASVLVEEARIRADERRKTLEQAADFLRIEGEAGLAQEILRALAQEKPKP
jgi:hypothetical protein